MKKTMIAFSSALVAASLMVSGAMAAPNGEKGPNEEAKGQVRQTAEADQTAATKNGQTATPNKETGKPEKPSVTEVTYSKKPSVTEATYAKGNGYLGLQRAYENVKDKPAGEVIAGLLAKYGIDVTAQEAADALTDLADKAEAQGDVEAAVDLQQEAVKTDSKNVRLYKKLGHLYAKLGKTGVKAYVNGEQPKFEVPPFIKDGSTLVPFRAISEALKAEVTWNPEERSVTVVKGDITIKLIIGSKTAYVNGKEVTLEVPGEIYEGNTMVPVRFISESLKAAVEWEPETQSVIINE